MAHVPPQNLDAEESVLGAALLSAGAVGVCSEILRADQFYRASHGLIYQAALDLYANGDPVDAITVSDELDRRGQLEAVGGRIRINELAAIVPAGSNAAHYARIVVEHARMRALAAAGAEIAALAHDRHGTADEVVDQAEQALFRAAHNTSGRDLAQVAGATREALDRVVAAADRDNPIVGVPTGFLWFDRITTGLLPGNLVVAAGRPSMGKSGLALGVAAHASLRADVPAAVFTLEMSRSEVVARLLSSEALIDSTKLRTGRLAPDEWRALHAASARIAEAPLYLDDTPVPTVTEIRSKARRLKMREPRLGLVVVDYLQLVGGGAVAPESRVQEVSQISRALKALARDLDLPIIAVSQLSRAPEQRHDKRPVLSDLRESGSIEQDADLVLLVYRDDYYHPDDTDAPGVAEVNIAKHRNGPTQVVKLAFQREYARFSNLDPSHH